jgi:hypothetical protein
MWGGHAEPTPNNKIQITNKSQNPMTENPNVWILEFGTWILFVFWCL